MSKKIDQTGHRYGKLLVLNQAQEERGQGAKWWCKCDCGRIIIAGGHELRRGRKKSCGCLKRSINEIGKTYNKLTVIEYAGLNKTGQALWRCQCECGNIVEVLGINLRNGNTKSCGCLKSSGQLKIGKLLLKNNIPFEKEKKFDLCRFPDTNFPARFDFYVNNKYIIEYDGIQHFKHCDSSSTWNTEENLKITKKRDVFKNQWCKENNIPLIRIPYTHLKDLCIEDLLLETSSFIIS